jgi:hypothetical protein
VRVSSAAYDAHTIGAIALAGKTAGIRHGSLAGALRATSKKRAHGGAGVWAGRGAESGSRLMAFRAAPPCTGKS